MPSSVYKCGRCGALANGLQPLRAPFMRMGSAMVEENVCARCHAIHMDAMKEFWGPAVARPTHACRRCGVDFSGAEAVIVQHEPKGDGSWTQAAVCAGCFKVFEDCCRKARNNGKGK